MSLTMVSSHGWVVTTCMCGRYHWEMIVFCTCSFPIVFSSASEDGFSFLFLLSFIFPLLFSSQATTTWTESKACLGLAMTHFEFLGLCLTWFLKSIILSPFLSLSFSLSLSLSLSLLMIFFFYLGGSFFQAKSCLLACRTIRSSRKRSAKDLRDPLQGNIGIWNVCNNTFL